MRRVYVFKNIKIIIVLIILIFAMDFVPIKMGVSENNDNIFLYKTKLNPDIGFTWVLYDDINHKEATYIAKIIGEEPYDVLSENEFEPYKIFSGTDEIKIKFHGDIKAVDSDYYDIYVYSDGWDIIKPIYRTSFRNIYAPKSYLTIYDYDWIKVVKRLL